MSSAVHAEARMSSGVAELDHILNGGFPRNRLYLIQGDPGTGKTTLALQFLMAGVQRGETGLYVTLSETEEELTAVAHSHGWTLDGLAVHDLSLIQDRLADAALNTFFHPAEVELNEIIGPLLERVEKQQAVRVVFDSLSEMRLLAGDPLHYRRQILALKQFFTGRHCTVLLLDDRTAEGSDLQLQSIAHGVLQLEHLSPEYGTERRRLRVLKLRGSPFRGGYHDFRVETGGLQIFPRIIASEHEQDFERGLISSDLPALDDLLCGGLDRGSSALLMGPAGSGKSVLASQYVSAAARRGEPAVVFLFDEGIDTFRARSTSLGIEIPEAASGGSVVLRQVDPAEVSPGEFAQMVRRAVEQDGARIVVIDSINGYLNAMPAERFLTIQLHELLTYLARQGVLTLVLTAQHGLLGPKIEAPVDVSYLADTVLLLRFFEGAGEVRQAISVMKKRMGPHERSIRELRIAAGGLSVGEPLRGFQGVLSGTPVYVGSQQPLLNGRNDDGEPAR